jgi:hypothetical protein
MEKGKIHALADTTHDCKRQRKAEQTGGSSEEQPRFAPSRTKDDDF